MRCVHEAQLHDRNCFITLTYNEENLPEYGSLAKVHLTTFLKRLRYRKGPFRYYACGEYGDNTQRAHYHACIFGMDFDDKIEFRKIGDNILYISEELNQIWGHGNTSIGELNFSTAAYTARYCMKKQTGKKKHGYVRIEENTGEIIPLEQPYAVMSLRPAIAKTWIEKYHGDAYNKDKDYVTLRGVKMRPAKYYDKIYDIINPEHMAMIKHFRKEKSTGLTQQELDARARIACARESSKSQI